MTRKLLAGLALALSPVSAQAAPPAVDFDPALWVVKDTDTTIYLFGTVHALKPGLDWFNDEVKTAFDASQDLVIEVDMPDDKAALGEQVRKFGLLPAGQTLPAKLSPAGRKMLRDDLASLGLPSTTLDPYKPFFAAVSLTMLHLMAEGTSSEEGVEKLLEATAKANGKKVGSLESMDFQLSLFDALPEKEQVRMLEEGLKNKEFAQGNLDDIVTAWGKGDAEAVAKIINATDNDSPLLYQKLLVERNANWADWVQNRLKSPGTTFVAVGAAHLAGSDSLQSMLGKKGITSARVPHLKAR